MSNSNDSETGTSWWVGDAAFVRNLARAQDRMRADTPSKGTIAYLQEVEASDERESMGLPRFKSAKKRSTLAPPPTPSTTR